MSKPPKPSKDKAGSSRDAPVTIKDLAKHAGVGLATASRAINGAYGVSEKTRRKVFASMKAIGYVPNQTAQNLRANKLKQIAVILNDIANTAYSQIAKGIYEKLDESSYSFSLCITGEVGVTDKIRTFLEGKKWGGIIVSVSLEDDAKLNRFLAGLQIPIIAIDRDLPRVPPGIVTDYESSVRQAMQYLFSLGHRGIALVAGAGNNRPVRVVRQAYRAAYEQMGLQASEEHMFKGEYSRQFGQYVMTRLLPDIQAGSVTAILSLNNESFNGMLQVLREHKLDYPDDVSLIALDDSELMQMLRPAITVIRRPLLDMGRYAAMLAIQAIEQPERYNAANAVTMPTEFIIRESCKARLS